MKSEEEKAKLVLFRDIVIVCAENLIGRWHQEGNIGHPQLQSPSQDQLATIHSQDTTERNPQNPGLRPKHPPEPERQRRARVATFWPHWALPKAGTASHPQSPQAYGFPSGKMRVRGGPPASPVWQDASRSPRWTSSCPSLARCFLEAHSGLASPWSLWESLGKKRKTSIEQ